RAAAEQVSPRQHVLPDFFERSPPVVFIIRVRRGGSSAALDLGSPRFCHAFFLLVEARQQFRGNLRAVVHVELQSTFKYLPYVVTHDEMLSPPHLASSLKSTAVSRRGG